MEYSKKMENTENSMEKSEDSEITKSTDKSASKPDMKASWRHFLILPLLSGLMYSGVLAGFVMGEWTQKMIRKQHFPNASESFSGCGVSVNSSDPNAEEIRIVQQIAARWGMLFGLADGIPTAIVTLFLPSYTDSFGRKFLIVFTIAGMTARGIIGTLVVYFEASFWYIFASNIVLGFTGSMYSLFSASFSMVADLTHTENQRTIGIVVMDVFLLLPGVIGSYTSGLFIETLGLNFTKTSIMATSIGIGVFLLSLLLKESHPPHKRSPRLSMVKTIKRMTDFYISSEFKGRRKAYIYLLAAFGTATMASINRGGMETLYFLGQPFCWGPSKIGTFSMARNAAQAIIGLGSIRILQKCLSNANIGVLSTLTNSISFVIEAFAKSTLMIYMVPVTGMFSFLVLPMMRSLLSSITAVDKQGAVFASIAIIEVICTLAANLSQNTIYSYTMSFMNGFVFLICAILSFINMLLMIGFQRAQREMIKKGINIEASGVSNKKEETNKTNPDYGTKL